jgi:hypothetical protein
MAEKHTDPTDPDLQQWLKLKFIIRIIIHKSSWIQMFEVHSNFEKRSEVNIRKKVNLLNFSHLKSSKQPYIGSNNFLRPHLI